MYRAPVRDHLLMLDVVGYAKLSAEAFPHADAETTVAILEAAAAFAEQAVAPLNRTGDLVGPRFEQGEVTLAPGFAETYRQYAAQGWTALSASTEHGGQGLPQALELSVCEFMQAASMAFGLCPILTLGAVEALERHGSERQKRLILPRLVEGTWTGTMNLTESQAGSDLAAIATRAEADSAGGYRLTGEKIFISWGDHDAAENICHLVLARTPEAPAGVAGLSLFLATKYLVDDDGNLGEPNSLRAASIEHKLGIHGSPTCVMVFDGARAELVGGLGEGLAQMFVMMNAARLHVGVQGVAIAERAFQQALAYATERRQGRALWSEVSPAAIYDHPDVRRTLTLAKARIEAARGICLLTGVLSDEARVDSDPERRADAKARQELLTPIAKAWSTDIGVDVASVGLQIHGGMGFIEETGAAQHYRDARITPIYEGTNAIQAADLVGRKVRQNRGRTMTALCETLKESAGTLKATTSLEAMGETLDLAADALIEVTAWLVGADADSSALRASQYLSLAGDVIGGWLLCRQALAVAQADDDWSRSKVILAELYAQDILTLAPGRAKAMTVATANLRGLLAQTLRV